MADLIRYTPEILAKINKLRLGGMSWQRIGLQLNPPASEHAVRNAAMSHQLPCMSVSKDDLKLWVGDRLAKLRVAWPHFTVVELAAQFKCTPNAITGAAHRIHQSNRARSDHTKNMNGNSRGSRRPGGIIRCRTLCRLAVSFRWRRSTRHT